MFRFTGKPSSGSHSQYLAKITHLVKSGYVEPVVSVMAAYCDLFTVVLYCDLFTIVLYCNTDNVLYELYVSTFNQGV